MRHCKHNAERGALKLDNAQDNDHGLSSESTDAMDAQLSDELTSL